MAAFTRVRRESVCGSMASSAPSSMVHSRRPRSSWAGIGCGRCARWRRRSSGSSGHPSTGTHLRSVRFSRPKECEGAVAIDPASTEAHRAIEAIWRIESARLIAGLARVVGDIGTAEELAQDALVAALERWPTEGVPEKPGAWLMGTAKHRAIDMIRRRQTLDRKHQEIGRNLERDHDVLELDAGTEEEVVD